MVGGRLIEIVPYRFPEGTRLGRSRDVLRLWVISTNPGCWDETCVYAEPQDNLPALGDEIWWQSGQIMFDGDRQTMRKIGASFAAPGSPPPD